MIVCICVQPAKTMLLSYHFQFRLQSHNSCKIYFLSLRCCRFCSGHSVWNVKIIFTAKVYIIITAWWLISNNGSSFRFFYLLISLILHSSSFQTGMKLQYDFKYRVVKSIPRLSRAVYCEELLNWFCWPHCHLVTKSCRALSWSLILITNPIWCCFSCRNYCKNVFSRIVLCLCIHFLSLSLYG